MRIKLIGLALPLLLLCAFVPACSRRHKESEPAPDVVVDSEPAAPKPKKYRAWCNNEKKFLGNWDVDRSHAEARRDNHNRLFPHHPVRIDVAD